MGATGPERQKVIGGDGVCLLPDGTRVYALGAEGMMAEKATVGKDRVVAIPHGLDDCIAAALPNGVIGAAMALRFRAGIPSRGCCTYQRRHGFHRPGSQFRSPGIMARVRSSLRARNPQSLKELLTLGADKIISVHRTDSEFVGQLRQLHRLTPINVVIDYLWGHTAEMIMAAIKGDRSVSERSPSMYRSAQPDRDLIQLSAWLTSTQHPTWCCPAPGWVAGHAVRSGFSFLKSFRRCFNWLPMGS